MAHLLVAVEKTNQINQMCAYLKEFWLIIMNDSIQVAVQSLSKEK